MPSNEIYDAMVQPRGLAYRDSSLRDNTHYRDPIDRSSGRLAGNSHIWGDASPQVQSRSIDSLLGASERAGLSTRQTAHVLAIARAESGFNPDAAAGSSSAYGLGQFIDKTGEKYGLDAQTRANVDQQSDALVAHFLYNEGIASDRGVGEEYVYKYHHDGPVLDSGGLALSREKVVPYIDQYETFVRDRQLVRSTQDATVTLISDTCHRDHVLYQQVQAGVYKLDAQHGRLPDTTSERLTAALVVSAKQSGLTRVDEVVLGTNAERVFAVQRGAFDVLDLRANVKTMEAINTSVVQSSQQLVQVNQAQERSQAQQVPLQPVEERSHGGVSR